MSIQDHIEEFNARYDDEQSRRDAEIMANVKRHFRKMDMKRPNPEKDPSIFWVAVFAAFAGLFIGIYAVEWFTEFNKLKIEEVR